jgi:uncharacterized membrane protein
MPQTEEALPAAPTRSTVAIGRHPLHPALVDFPIAFLSGALAADLLFWRTGSAQWADLSFWLIAAGLASGLVAFLAGLVDFLTIARARQTRAGWLHFLFTDLALFLSTFNLVARLEDRPGAVLFAGLGYSLAVTLFLLLGGYTGGRLVFGHMIGVYGGLPGREQERERGA